MQLSLFDQQDLAEIRSPDFPQERLVACYHPLLAAERGRQRQELLASTEQDLEKVAQQVRRRTRTFRLALPPSLRCFDVDLADMIAYRRKHLMEARCAVTGPG